MTITGNKFAVFAPTGMLAQRVVVALTVALAIALSGVSQRALAAPASYQIDPDHLSIGFLVEHLGYAKTNGMFRQASGSYQFDEKTGELTNVQIVVKTDSVFTNHDKRDKHLRGKDFLNTSQYPEMHFRAAGAQKSGAATFLISGELELLGAKSPVALTATVNKSAPYPIPGVNAHAMGVSIRGSFKRSAFGMNYAVKNGWVGDDVELIIEFEARRQ